MIFSELYSVYYNTVAKIISSSFDSDVTEEKLRCCVAEEAFSESALTILPALKSGKWPLLGKDLSPVLNNKPTMPLTLLEKRWLKAVSEDPRVRLFGVDFPELDDVEPLFTSDDYKVFDKYSDGDPYEDESYIEHFRTILSAIRENRAVDITMTNRYGRKVRQRVRPKGFEYSVKDDKIRIVGGEHEVGRLNLARVKSCEFSDESRKLRERRHTERYKDLTLIIRNELNAFERVMLHFAHFEKRAERLDDNRYILHLRYYESDETEIVIRVLSFGPYVKVTEPQSFVNLIKERLILQKSRELR